MDEERAENRAEVNEPVEPVEKPKKKRVRRPWSPEERAKHELNDRLRAEGKLPPRKKRGRPPWTPEQIEHYKYVRKKNAEERETKELQRYSEVTGIPMKPIEDPNQNTKWLKQARVGLDLPPVDTRDPNQIGDRINQYLDFCEINNKKPSVVGMANWIGVPVDTVMSWRSGRKNNLAAPFIRRVMAMLEEVAVEAVMETKTNPANFIFLMKNHFGYVDQQNVVMGTVDDSEKEMSKEDLEKYFLEDGSTVDTTFADQEGEK